MQKLTWCLQKESRLKIIPPNKHISQEHIIKAKHNIKAMNYNIEGGFTDWAISQAYYTMYHAMLAILYRTGYESKNHECTLQVIEHLIKTNKLVLDKKYLAIIKTTEQMTNKDAKALREEFQYGTQTSANKIIIETLGTNAKKIIEETEIALNKIV